MYDWNNEVDTRTPQQKARDVYAAKQPVVQQEPVVETPLTEAEKLQQNLETAQAPINVGKDILPTDPSIYGEQAAEEVGAIYDPLMEGLETQKEGVDLGAKLQIEGMEKAIPYVTRQFESYQAKTGFGTGMQMRQQNELVMDIAESMGEIYNQATLEKYAIDSKISEYQSAMAAGELSRATELWNQAQSQAQFAADYLGMDYIQPEVGFMYDQMTASQAILNDPNASDSEKTNAQTNYDTLISQLQTAGYTGDIGEGLQTYQQQQAEIQQAYLDIEEFVASELYDVSMGQIMDTNMAFSSLLGGMSIQDVIQQYPGADYMMLLELQQEIASGGDALSGLGIDYSKYNVTETEE
jgi:hypothetical protein